MYQPTQYQDVMKKKPSPWGGILANLLTMPLSMIPGVGGMLQGVASSGLQSATNNMGMGAKYRTAAVPGSGGQSMDESEQRRRALLNQWLPPLR